MGLSNAILTARIRSGKTQSEVSKQTGINIVSISRYENDRRTPTLSNLNKLCECYNVTLCDIMEFVQNEKEVLK